MPKLKLLRCSGHDGALALEIMGLAHCGLEGHRVHGRAHGELGHEAVPPAGRGHHDVRAETLQGVEQ